MSDKMKNISDSIISVNQERDTNKVKTNNSMTEREMIKANAPAQSDNRMDTPEVFTVHDSPLQMTIKVLQATNIKGSKGEHVNSYIRSQFADFDFKDSNIITDNANPEYNLSYDHSFVVDDVYWVYTDI